MNLLKTTLDNGLTVLIRETHTAPVASVWLWYRVGSGDEMPGKTGSAHWVEHMLFKGTERWPEGAADEAIAREGGVFNGMTWLDFTTFYETLPADKIALALDIEADRMVNARFDPEEVESERTVILSERHGAENNPLFLLEEKLMAAAFTVHPYGHDTLGSVEDLRSMTRDDLYAHYRMYYRPNNAVLAIAGDFNAGEIERLAERYFAPLERGPEPERPQVTEPPQTEERRVEHHGEAGVDYLLALYHIPPATHPDFFPLTVLNAILVGGSGLIVSGGGLSNHTSRLYRALVERDRAIDVSGSLYPTRAPGMYTFAATVHPASTLEVVEKALDDELARIQNEPVSSAELEKAKRQARALFAFSSESITNQAFWLGYSEMFASYTWFINYLRRLEAVSTEDVLRVAQTYLRPTNRTVGWYIGRQRA